MKALSKIFLALFAAVCLPGFFMPLTPAMTAAAAPVPELEWTLSARDVRPGDEVEVTVSLKNYADTAVLELLGLQVDVRPEAGKAEYITGSAKTLAAAAGSQDILSTTYKPESQTVIFLFLPTGKEGLPRTNTALFSFKVRADAAITSDTAFSLVCTRLAVIDADGNHLITVSDHPSVNIHTGEAVITLNGQAPAGAPYTDSVTVAFDKGTATIKKDGGPAVPIDSGYVISAGGQYEVTVTDAAGNTAVAFFAVDLPQKTVLGNVSGSGTLSITDARMILQYLVDKITLTAEQLELADVDGKNGVTVTDARYVLQRLVEKIDKFPVE
ncbi:MAG: hypothetical protein FWE80_10005 [Oscillospiraceae bacterium]|nr:hypothetical protein [Oscillospiraceae bacterium]